jgi:RNA polymerase sigma factor (sigma-70 family)
MSAADAASHQAVEAVWRIEAGQVIASLARITGDVGTAEEMAQDALLAALEQWPRTGVPPNPGGWLMMTAKNRAIDAHRRKERLQDKMTALGHEVEARRGAEAAVLDDAIDDTIGDDVLRLIFTACHPVLAMESRVALTLRCLGGLTTEEIARAFLRPDGNRGAADRPRQKDPRGPERALRASDAARDGGAAGRRPRGDLPDLQRGVLRHHGAGLDAP